jgi:hypothetical protein
MRAPMKEMISNTIAGVIKGWEIDTQTINALSNSDLVVIDPAQEASINQVKEKFKTLMRVSIEFFMNV